MFGGGADYKISEVILIGSQGLFCSWSEAI
jgi:hypothetical protein